jgi:hypothetical protein
MSKLKKYRYCDRYETSIITIPSLRKTITKENATDKDIEFLLKKFPGKFDHIFELVSGVAQKTEEAANDVAYPEGKPCMCKEWTIEHLKAYAKDHGIEIGTSQKKSAIFKKIKEANEQAQ